MPDNRIKRCDVRVPIDLYNQIEKIAVSEYNAPTYHKTGKPQVSSTIIQLLRLGIANLRGDVSANLSDKISDKFLSQEVDILKTEVEKLKSKFVALEEKFNRPNIPNNLGDNGHNKDLSDTLPDELSDNDDSPQTFYSSPASSELVSRDTYHDEASPSQIDKTSLAPIFEERDDEEEEEEEIDYSKVKVSNLRRIITIKGLGQKFREKMGKTPREARKAEIIKFLSTTLIFD